MFPKLMSMAGNTIILDIICETGSQRVLTAGSELVSNSDKFCSAQSNSNTRLMTAHHSSLTLIKK